MKYVVAAGVCYTHKGKNYVEGDEITRDIFKPAESFDKAVEDGKIIAVGKAEVKKEATEENSVVEKEVPENTEAKKEVKASKKGGK